MFIPISIEDFIKDYKKHNKNENIDKLKENLLETVEAKQKGESCNICGQPIWAIGTATVGSSMCFTCITGEADNSEDYEVDTVCFL